MKVKFEWKMTMIMVCLVSLIALTACNGTPAKNNNAEAVTPPTAQKKMINIGITNGPGSFNPLDTVDTTVAYLTELLFLPLVNINDKLTFDPILAESIETKDNQTYEVKLNPKAKWTDGQPVTADDVIFTVQLIGNPKITSSFSSNFAILDGFDESGKLPPNTTDISGVKKVDDHTVDFRTKTPVDPLFFNNQIGSYLKTLPKHVLKDVAPEALFQHPFMQKPDVVDGAFKLVSYQKDQLIQFEANKDYYKGVPKLDQLNIKIMQSANLVAQLQSGEIDMNYPLIGNFSIQDYDTIKNMANVKAIPGRPVGSQTLLFNLKTVPDVRVRQAIVYAINRQQIVTNLLKGEGEVNDVPYTSVNPYQNKDLKPTAYDPEKAKQLLKEANWDPKQTLKFVVPAGNKSREQAADLMVQDLSAVGIKAQVEKFDIATVMSKARKHDFDMFIVALPLVYSPDPDLSTYFKTGEVNNFTQYSNPELDALMDQGKKETDTAKRKPIYDQAQTIIIRDMPQVVMYVAYNLKAVSNRVTVGGPKEFGMFNDVYQWDVSK